jgi:hypothetical protein
MRLLLVLGLVAACGFPPPGGGLVAPRLELHPGGALVPAEPAALAAAREWHAAAMALANEDAAAETGKFDDEGTKRDDEEESSHDEEEDLEEWEHMFESEEENEAKSEDDMRDEKEHEEEDGKTAADREEEDEKKEEQGEDGVDVRDGRTQVEEEEDNDQEMMETARQDEEDIEEVEAEMNDELVEDCIEIRCGARRCASLGICARFWRYVNVPFLRVLRFRGRTIRLGARRRFRLRRFRKNVKVVSRSSLKRGVIKVVKGRGRNGR